jgi:hypothetical protein
MNINFTKTVFLISFIYLGCFQLFLSSGSLGWLYAGNLLFFVASLVQIFLYQLGNPTLCLSGCAIKGMRFSFRSALIALAGSTMLLILNGYINFTQQNAAFDVLLLSNFILKDINHFAILLFTNSFLINVVSGSLASVFIAGIMNEKNYFNSSKPLPSVK